MTRVRRQDNRMPKVPYHFNARPFLVYNLFSSARPTRLCLPCKHRKRIAFPLSSHQTSAYHLSTITTKQLKVPYRYRKNVRTKEQTRSIRRPAYKDCGGNEPTEINGHPRTFTFVQRTMPWTSSILTCVRWSASHSRRYER